MTVLPPATHARTLARRLHVDRDGTIALTAALAMQHAAGRRAGQAQAKREWALRLWERRFGAPDIDTVRRLLSADNDQLERVLDGLVSVGGAGTLVATLQEPPGRAR